MSDFSTHLKVDLYICLNSSSPLEPGMAMVGQLSVQVEEGLAHMQMFGLFIYLLTLRLTSVAIFLALFFDLTVFLKTGYSISNTTPTRVPCPLLITNFTLAFLTFSD